MFIVEYTILKRNVDEDEEFWIIIEADRQPYCNLGPFDTKQECQRALDDILSMTRSQGAKDVPLSIS